MDHSHLFVERGLVSRDAPPTNDSLCLECPDVNPSCPECPSGQTCIQIAKGCHSCAQNICVSQAQAGISQTSINGGGSNGPNIGAIAGGVIGGIFFIAIITYLIWRFFLKGRRRETEELYPEDYDPYGEKSPETDFTPSSAARQSTHSVRSMASTVMTRASNVIQIAFIPGITDRGQEGDLIPPVPAIPLRQSSPSSSHPSTPYEDHHSGTPYSDASQHYFMPMDLNHQSRSRYSSAFSDDTSAFGGDRRSTRHQSVASSLVRESMASTIYNDSHVHAMPAVTALRGRANVVSVRPSNTTTPGGPATIPEVPSVDYFKYGDGQQAGEGQDANGSGEGSSQHNPPSTKAPSSGKPSSKLLAAAIHEATRRASRQPTHGGLGSLSPRKDPSPFSDQHAVPPSE